MLEDIDIDGVNGTAPSSGIDLEPNKGNSGIAVTLRRVSVKNAAG